MKYLQDLLFVGPSIRHFAWQAKGNKEEVEKMKAEKEAEIKALKKEREASTNAE